MKSSKKQDKSFGLRTVTSTGLSSRGAGERFELLQTKLIPLWKSIREMNEQEQTIVVVPSLTIIGEGLGSIEQAYEERFLFLLLLLRQPNAQLIYITSKPILEPVIDYYLSLLPQKVRGNARQRLHLISAGDGTNRPLSEKLLERPRLLKRIRNLIADPNRAHLVPFNTTILERDLSLRLGIPMYAADPKFLPLGLKSGCRRLFAEEGVAHPHGFGDLKTIGEVVEAICKIRADKPHVRKVIIKLNEGVSGEGNAILDLEGLPEPGNFQELDAVASKLRKMQMQSSEAKFKSYMENLSLRGGIVEEMILGSEVRSPSVQMRVTPLGELQTLSTHDQLLGGRSGQNYLGAKFPADAAYAATISREAEKIGKRLASEGVIGRFAIDFLVVRSSDQQWHAYAIELNLRKGGTTHPFLTLEFLTDGKYDSETATFKTPAGVRKFFVATDHVKSPIYKALTVEDVFDLADREKINFDASLQTGVVFHMVSAISEHGRLGFTAIANSHEEAHELYSKTIALLDHEAEAANADPGLPEF